MRRSTALRCAVSAALFSFTSLTFAQSPAACSALTNYTASGLALKITKASHDTNRQTAPSPFGPGIALPPHCHVEGELDRRTGSNGKSYALRFAINLPDNWNGRYMFQGGGGLNGSLGEPIGTQATGSQSALARGFAVVSTDSGHEGQVFDGSFLAEQEAAMNFNFLGNMRVTNATKPIVAEYYKKQINKSYFVGCSTGGREGMIMAQRFPLLFDGIITGAPAIRTDLSNLALRWMNMHWNQAAAKGADGKPLPGGTYSKEEQKILMDGLLQACDALDGAKDGLIHNVAACKFDPRTLACKAGTSTNCLAPDKAEAMSKAVAGPVDSRGIQVYSRFQLDTGNDDARGMWNGGSTPPEGLSVSSMLTQDVDAELIAAANDDRLIANSTSVNLSSFSAHGGKQLFYHGVSDPWFSAMDTVSYYERMTAANGGLTTVDKWSRTFLVPGMAHCQGGDATLDNFDMLSAIVDWVEKDKAPESIESTGRTMPGVSRPLCPYPQHSQYSGSGDINKAENFSCKAP
jgi:pimeloyl-ACP methyl ester carboxylesterase